MSAIRRRIVTGALVATASVGLVAAGSGVSEAAVSGTLAAAASTPRVAPLSVRFVRDTTPVAKPKGATFQGVRVIVTGGRKGAAAAVSTAMARHLAERKQVFTAEAAVAAGDGIKGSDVFDAVSGGSARSVHYLSIRIDESVNLGGAHPANSTHAYVFDLATGREVKVASIFVSPSATDRTIRAALVAKYAKQPFGLTAKDVAKLSVVPDKNGSTAPLSCYPTGPGLTCGVDQGAVLGHAAGPLEVTVPWKSLKVRS